PLLAPAPIAWIGMGFVVDMKLAEELETTTSAGVSFVQGQPAGQWTPITSTLTADAQRALLTALSKTGQTGAGSFKLDGTDLETLVIPLPSTTGARINLVLHRSLAQAM